jgi:methyl-accepting chemotaxis protein
MRRVEAARAGEQGRGFAVVASEVRSLAQRSAAAAKEIKGLITDSVERVEQGTALVDQAGETMSEIVSSIKRVTDIMGEISAASTEQASGVVQVAEAVTQMDQATQQNSALVEESAAAAESLRTQAQQLVEAVAFFKLSSVEILKDPFPRAAPPALERRGPHRATNVTRPKFTKQYADTGPSSSQRTAQSERSGTNDWAAF